MNSNLSEENFYSRESIDTGKMFHGEYIINASNKNANDLTEYEKKLGFGDVVKPTLIDVDCYVNNGHVQFLVHAHTSERNDYRVQKALLTKDEYFHLISDLTLENTEY